MSQNSIQRSNSAEWKFPVTWRWAAISESNLCRTFGHAESEQSEMNKDIQWFSINTIQWEYQALTVTWNHPAPFSTSPLALLLRAEPGMGEFRRRNVLVLCGSKSSIRSSSSSICVRKLCSTYFFFNFIWSDEAFFWNEPVFLKLTRRLSLFLIDFRMVMSDGRDVVSRSSCSEMTKTNEKSVWMRWQTKCVCAVSTNKMYKQSSHERKIYL